MAGYDNAPQLAYTVAGATLSSAATLLQVAGPKGKQGRLVSVSCVVTTSTTVAATQLRVGTVADPDAFGTLNVPIVTAPAVANTSVDLTSDINLIPADGIVQLATDGGATAGAGTIVVVIRWF